MNAYEEYLQAVTRRHFLAQCGVGLGGMALGSLIGGNLLAEDRENLNPMAARQPSFAPKAKSVIYLHMAGSPSQLELFDYKPVLKKHDAQACPKEFLDGKRFAFIHPDANPVMMGPVFDFQQHGQAGTWISELLPNIAAVADELCVIRAMFTTQFNHSPAQLLLQTGDPRFGSPAMGSWVTYGLGSENENLPGFVVLVSGGKTPSAGKSVWGSGYLPSVYQGTQCRNTGDPVLYLSNPQGLDRASRRRQLDALRDLNEMQHRSIGDPETISRISQYELTFRMQTTAAEVMDISRETKATLDMYGARPGMKSTADSQSVGDKPLAAADDPAFANNCLLARRLVESGVRFVQLYDWGWDHHGASQPEDIKTHLPVKTRQIDRPVAALISDLKQRGLLEDTLRESNQRVPFLGSLPLIGALFRVQKMDAVKTNLMVFIRPKILRNSVQTAFETNSKYNAIRDVQRESSSFGVLRSDDRPSLPPLETYQNSAPDDSATTPESNE